MLRLFPLGTLEEVSSHQASFAIAATGRGAPG
jgi:hypothetical protein